MSILKTPGFLNVLVPLMSVISSAAVAGYNNILWVPVSKDIIPQVTLSDNLSSNLTKTISIKPFSGYAQMKAVDAECVSFSKNGTKMSTQWIKYPNSGELPGGLKWSLTLNPAGAGGPYSGSRVGGTDDYKFMPFAQKTEPYKNQSCIKTGGIVSWTISSGGILTGTLSFDEAQARPGVYNLVIPLSWGYEENKRSGGDSGSVWRRIGGALNDGTMVMAQTTITLQSQCSYNMNDINLSHGSITLDGHTTSYPSNNYPLQIKCKNGTTTVNVSIVGNSLVPGKTENFTPCGEGGNCELTFDTSIKNDVWNEKIDVNGHETINVKSSYHPGSSPVAGKFNGSGILKIRVE